MGRELAAAVLRLSDDRLAAAQAARSYRELIQIVSGKNPDALLFAAADTGTGTLGDNQANLVFHAITPCRILDTRVGTGDWAGLRLSESTTDVNTSRATNYTDQGGIASPCPGQVYEAGGLAFNVTVVDYTGNGFLTVYPYSATPPLASTINFGPGTSPTPVANSSVVQQCYVCGPDVSVYVEGASTNVIIDVIGYFDPETWPAGYWEDTTGTTLVNLFNYIMSPTTITADRRLICQVTANVSAYNVGNNGGGVIETKTALRIGSGSPDEDPGPWQTTSYTGATNPRGSMSRTYLWTLDPGSTYQFGCAVWSTVDYVGDTVYCSVTWSCR